MGMGLLGKRGEGYGFGGFSGFGDRNGRPDLPEQQRYERPAPRRAPLPAKAPAPYSGPRGPYDHHGKFNEQEYLRANRA